MSLPFTPPLFERFADFICSLPPSEKYEREHLCICEFRLQSDGVVEIFYAPFDSVNTAARVAIVGLTPGFQQMEIAFRTARAALLDGKTAAEAGTEAKAQASFAGSMRRNLISMLAGIGLGEALGIADPALLFGSHLSLLHTTSAIRYPVFVKGANYTGHAPPPLRHSLLREMVFEVLAPELAEVPGALIIPLGKAVGDCLCALISAGVLGEDRCLLGFPHPSGLNGHREQQFKLNQDALKEKTASWFTRTASTAMSEPSFPRSTASTALQNQAQPARGNFRQKQA